MEESHFSPLREAEISRAISVIWRSDLLLNVSKINLITADVTSEVKIKLEKKKIKGEDHVVVSKLYLKITVKSGKLYLGNLFGGQNVALAELVNEAINQNFISFSKELFPLVEKALSRIFKQTSNKILTRFTEAQLFP